MELYIKCIKQKCLMLIIWFSAILASERGKLLAKIDSLCVFANAGSCLDTSAFKSLKFCYIVWLENSILQWLLAWVKYAYIIVESWVRIVNNQTCKNFISNLANK